MPEGKARKIADAAEMIVGGFAHMLAHPSDRLMAMFPAKLLRLFRFA